jgi:hypothetical protein
MDFDAFILQLVHLHFMMPLVSNFSFRRIVCSMFLIQDYSAFLISLKLLNYLYLVLLFMDCIPKLLNQAFTM